jgi:hypothetical protein
MLYEEIALASAACTAGGDLTGVRLRPRQSDAEVIEHQPLGEDFTRLGDSALLSLRAEMRAELERLPPGLPGHAALTAVYDKTTEEVDDRARRAWARTS